jgi:tellurite resistance protein TerC
MSSIDVPAWAWGLLAGLVLCLITIDLYAHRGEHADSKRRALAWSAGWIACALAFNGWIALHFGAEAGEQFLAAYLLEKSLSVDNLFVFLIVFGALAIPASEQRRVLTWGIVGALLMRGGFIAVGAAVLERWSFVTYVFGALLVFTAAKLLRAPATESEPALVGWLERHLPWTRERDGHHFFTHRSGKWLATPLFVALVAIELSDVVFAVDSVPAAFAVSDTPFIIYASNVFAILGLRSLYIVLAAGLAELRYLRPGLAAVLAFAGAKMLLAPWVHISPLVSVGVIVACIGAAVLASVAWRRRQSSRHHLAHDREQA